MLVKDLIHFEEQCKLARQWKRGDMCRRLGISQAKWRRHVEDHQPHEEVEDRTLGLAMAALWAGLDTYGAVTFTRLAQQPFPASGPTSARINHQVHFCTWPKEEPANEKA